MIRITDQYFWNFIFWVFFVFMVVMGAIVLETESRILFSDLTAVDFILMTLATWRIIQLAVYDHSTRWFREQFYDVKKVGKGFALEKPKVGPRRTIADIMSCPWCFGLWAGAVVVFLYLITPYAFYVALLLAISTVASFLQIMANMIGWQAEKLEQEVEG